MVPDAVVAARTHLCRIHGLAPGTLATDGLTLKVLAASVAATLGSTVANPTDLVKGLSLLLLRPHSLFFLRRTESHGATPTMATVRMQAHYPTGGSPYRSTRHAFASIWREGSLRALYRGTDATTLRGVVLSVSQICAYDQLKQSLKRRGVMQEGLALHFTASMLAGFICSQPRLIPSVRSPIHHSILFFTRCVIGLKHAHVDVVKVRVMNDKEHKFGNVLDCVRTMLRQEGPMAFYKGFSMCWARVHFIRLRLRSLNLEPIQLGAHTVLCFVVAFERLRDTFWYHTYISKSDRGV
ncbi:mitochondrial carrier domain-containing protein [Lactarius deliciosus]|nr:mitochondrial carrier domain-containing protein [Lactarius deliciosus]